MLGYLLGLIGKARRKLVLYCILGAVLPDIDAIPYLFGVEYYDRFHHTFGHNVFLWILFAGFVTWKFRSFSAFLLSTVCFGSHLLTDYFLSGWPIYFLWPLTRQGWMSSHAVGLEHP